MEETLLHFSHATPGLKPHSYLTSKWIIYTFLGFNHKILFKKSIFQGLKTRTQQDSPSSQTSSAPCVWYLAEIEHWAHFSFFCNSNLRNSLNSAYWAFIFGNTTSVTEQTVIPYSCQKSVFHCLSQKTLSHPGVAFVPKDTLTAGAALA